MLRTRRRIAQPACSWYLAFDAEAGSDSAYADAATRNSHLVAYALRGLGYMAASKLYALQRASLSRHSAVVGHASARAGSADKSEVN